MEFESKPWAVIGLGASGTAAARFLEDRGAVVYRYDDKGDHGSVASLDDVPWPDLTGAVFSPGIPDSHPAFARAREAATLVYCDIDLLLHRYHQTPVVAVTGTNGKSTTTALIAHILKEAGYEAVAAGNIGLAAAGVELKHPEQAALVLECSSFQLDLTARLKPTVAVWLNITPDHLDRHHSLEGYTAAKRRIFRLQTSEDTAVIGADDAFSREEADRLAALPHGPRVARVSSLEPQPGGTQCTEEGFVHDGGFTPLPPCALAAGKHMRQNAAAAFAACRALGVDPDVIAKACAEFAPLPHRMERTAKIDQTLFVNDSKATNADAAAQALQAYPGCYWICGGKPKDGGIAAMTHLFPLVRRAYALGAAEEEFAALLESCGVTVRRCGDLNGALRAVTHDIENEDGGYGGDPKTVLFSPACASFDQWRNFEERGDAFRAMTRQQAALVTA